MVDETFEGYALDAPIDSVYPSGQTFTASADAARTGTRGARRVLSGTAAYIRRDIESASGRQLCRVEFRYPGAPPATASLLIARNRSSGDVGIGGVQILSTGLTQVIRGNAGTAITESRPTAPPFSGAGWYAIEMYHDPTGAGGLAHLGYRILDEDDTVLHEWTSPSTYDVSHDGPTTAWRIGGITSSQWASATLDVDNLRTGAPASGWLGRIIDPPVPVAVESDALVVDMRTSTPGGSGALAYALAHISGPDHTDDVEEPIDGLFIIPRDAATSVYRVTVTEVGGGSATYDVTVAPAGGDTGGIVEEVWISDSWV